MTIKDISFLNKEYEIVFGDIKIEDGIIVEIKEKGKSEKIDLYPLFLDLHIHGGFGVDITNSVSSEIKYLSKKLWERNVGGYMPTTVAKSESKILTNVKEIYLASKEKRYSEIVGVHIEGPFISGNYKGIMEEKYIRSCDIKLYEKIKNVVGELKVRFTIAPECEGAREFCEYVVKNGDYVSLGHSGASFEKTNAILEAGASSFTHIFNAMAPLHHRNVGIAGAGLLSDKYVEVICDFVHLSRELIEIICRLKEDKIILISDGIEAMGFGKGEYEFCGKNIYVDENSARDSYGRLAGSVLTLEKAIENMSKIVGFKQAIKMASENPAKLLGLEKYGHLDIGKRVKEWK